MNIEDIIFEYNGAGQSLEELTKEDLVRILLSQSNDLEYYKQEVKESFYMGLKSANKPLPEEWSDNE